jgi:hypothetical protein
VARLAGGAGEDPFQGWHVRVVPSGGDQHVAEAGEPAVRRVEPPPAPGVALDPGVALAERLGTDLDKKIKKNEV